MESTSLLFCSLESSYETLIGMTTDVYPRENCIAPAMVFIVWTTDTTNARRLAPECVPIVAIPPQKRFRARVCNSLCAAVLSLRTWLHRNIARPTARTTR